MRTRILFAFSVIAPLLPISRNCSDGKGRGDAKAQIAPFSGFQRNTLPFLPSALATILILLLPGFLSAQCVPGDSIGFTLHDFPTNGSAYRNLVNNGEGKLSLVRLGSTDSTNLGSWLSCSDDYGYTWTPLTRIEQTAITSSSGVDVFVAAGEIQTVLSRGPAGNVINIDTEQCVGAWQEGVFPSEYVGPRHAVGSASDLNILMLDADSLRLVHVRSPDFGGTWDPERYIFQHPGHIPEADAYDISARGTSVAAVTAGSGGDVVLAKSTDAGATWQEQVIYDVSGPGELLPGDDEWQPDGACAVTLDDAGNPHVVWSNYLAVVDDSGNTVLTPSIHAGILYWNDSTGIVEIAMPVQDSTMDPPVGRDGNFASQPDIGLDDSGDPLVIFSQLVSDRDDSMRNYQRVYVISSYDRGMTWGWAMDVGYYADGYDASFPSLADRIDNGGGFLAAHIVFNTDPWAGNHYSGNHPQIPVAIRYLQYGYIDLAADGEPSTPLQFSLDQNYPNPFNPTTTFRFSIPRSGEVSLRIFNLLGEEVATLVSGNRDAGTHTVQWDATGQSSGVYFYRLRAGEFVETRKLVLVR